MKVAGLVLGDCFIVPFCHIEKKARVTVGLHTIHNGSKIAEPSEEDLLTNAGVLLGNASS